MHNRLLNRCCIFIVGFPSLLVICPTACAETEPSEPKWVTRQQALNAESRRAFEQQRAEHGRQRATIRELRVAEDAAMSRDFAATIEQSRQYDESRFHELNLRKEKSTDHLEDLVLDEQRRVEDLHNQVRMRLEERRQALTAQLNSLLRSAMNVAQTANDDRAAAPEGEVGSPIHPEALLPEEHDTRFDFTIVGDPNDLFNDEVQFGVTLASNDSRQDYFGLLRNGDAVEIARISGIRPPSRLGSPKPPRPYPNPGPQELDKLLKRFDRVRDEHHDFADYFERVMESAELLRQSNESLEPYLGRSKSEFYGPATPQQQWFSDEWNRQKLERWRAGPQVVRPYDGPVFTSPEGR